MSGNRSIGGIKRRGSLARAAAAGLVTACCLLSPKVLSAQSAFAVAAAAARAQSEDRERGIVVATAMEERARVEPVDYEDAIARARVEYEEAVRLIAREQERLEQRVKELERALEETRRANAVPLVDARSAGSDQRTESVAEPSDPETVEPLLEELAKAKVEYEEALARATVEYQAATRAVAREQGQLEQRIKELEIAQVAQEDATRQIIREATSTLGSQINQFVAFGGSFEMETGILKTASGRSETILEVATAEVDFEVQANDWTLGSLTLEFVGDRFDIDTAFLTIGDSQKFPPFGTVGRMIVPFGISTGDPVADVLTLEDPLTIEAFEMRETAILIGAGFPTRPLAPATPPVASPPVRPRTLNPLVRFISRGLGYNPPPRSPQPPTPVTPTPAPPLFNVGLVVFEGTTSAATDGGFNYGATAGFVKKWDCGRPYDEGWSPLSCPFSIDVDVDYNSSVFDSRFLEFEYGDFLEQIGLVPGMASSVKAAVGGLSFVGEWNGALEHAPSSMTRAPSSR